MDFDEGIFFVCYSIELSLKGLFWLFEENFDIFRYEMRREKKKKGKK